MSRCFKLVIVSRKPPDHVALVVKELKTRGVKVDRVYAGDIVANPSKNASPCMLCFDQVSIHHVVLRFLSISLSLSVRVCVCACVCIYVCV